MALGEGGFAPPRDRFEFGGSDVGVAEVEYGHCMDILFFWASLAI